MVFVDIYSVLCSFSFTLKKFDSLKEKLSLYYQIIRKQKFLSIYRGIFTYKKGITQIQNFRTHCHGTF